MADDAPAFPRDPEPEDPAFLRWLSSPAGEAAMKEVMQHTLDGRHGEVPPELRALAAEGLQKRRDQETLQRVQTAMQALMAGMQQEPETVPSRWQHVHDLHAQAKDVTDLILETTEPQRTALMRLMLPLQEMLAKLERETE